MIDAHSLYLAGLVSQATFALTLALLAWSDRRTRGMTWLAAASMLQCLSTAVRRTLPPLAGSSQVAGSAAGTSLFGSSLIGAGSCLLVVLFFFVYMGMRWFVVRRRLRTELGPLAVGAAVILIVAESSVSPVLGLAMARASALVVIGITVCMLWRARILVLRFAARACAVMLSLVMAVLSVRLVADLLAAPGLHPSPATAARLQALTAFGRGATLVSVTLLSFSFIALFVAETNRRLHEETRIDVMTGLRNRRAMEEIAVREVPSALQTGTPLALLLLDLDRFKQLNDTWGHATGDRALRAVGSMLQSFSGLRDIAARVGGEEFAVLLPGRTLGHAVELAERFRSSVEELRLIEGKNVASLTVSIGVCVLLPSEQSWEEMMARADDALYRAKREGRNRVVVCGEETRPAPAAESSDRRAWRRWFAPRQGPLL